MTGTLPQVPFSHPTVNLSCLLLLLFRSNVDFFGCMELIGDVEKFTLEVDTFQEGRPMKGYVLSKVIYTQTTDFGFVSINFHFILRLESFLVFLQRKSSILSGL